MSFSELTILDFKNILEWYDLLSDKFTSIEKYKRTQEKVRGLFNIHEDRSEPLVNHLLASTLQDLDSHTNEDLKSASSLLQNRKFRLETKIKQIQESLDLNLRLLKSEMSSLEFNRTEFEKEHEESRDVTEYEIKKITQALERIDEKLSGEKQ